MYKISRREFFKYSALAIAGIYTQTRLPVLANSKSFTPFKFAFVPDLHLSNYKFDNWILLNESLLILQDTVKLLNDLDVDFIVFGGDLIDNEQRDYSELPTLLDLLYTLEKPYYVVMGDREARLNNNLSKEDFTVEFRRNGFINRGITCWFENPATGLDLIGLDSTIINSKDGEVSPNQLVWLANNLRQNANNFKIVVLHHPLNPDSKLNNFYNAPGFRLKNSSAIVDVFDRYQNVDLVLSAHHHVNLINTRNNVHYINSPSIVTYPCEFRIIEVNNSYIEFKNIAINFKQMIKKAQESLKGSKYSEEFPDIKYKELLKLHKGDKKDRDTKIKFE
ncbi:MAG: metallophosphoesterase [Cyanobacteriota bacterium]